jgi:hypothetical protein
MSSSGSDRRDPRNPPQVQGEGGFFQRILAVFVGMSDPDSDKKKLLRAIGKDLARSRYKFYRPKGQEALPGLAKFFYEIYKIVAPAQVLLGNAQVSGALRAFVIESFLTEEQRALTERLTEADIIERAKTLGLKELQESVKHDMTTLFSVFDGEMSRQVDGAYNTLLAFINFINFDFYFMLKKFDSALPERNFSYHPKFETINADYIVEDIQDFLEVFFALDFQTDWKRIFGAFREYRKAEVVQYEAWAKFLPAASDLRKSQILEQIVRHAKKDPSWSPQPRYPGERIVEPFMQKLGTQVGTLIQRIIQERRNSKIDEIAKQIFGTSVVLRMKNYTEKANVVFAKKMLGGYTQAPAMNYLKAYLMDFFKKDIRELVDLLIIRGQWTTAIQSQQLSDAYHSIMEVSDRIIEFDDSLADDSEMGTKIRSALAKAERDKDALKYLRQMLKETNDKATAMIAKVAVNLIVVGRLIKALVEDLARPHHELLLNWKEVEGQSPQPLRERLVEIYKKIYYMVQLLQFFVKQEE